MNETKGAELSEKIPVGISTCLLGEKVRYDGGHMRSKLCAEQLNKYFRWLPTCPEMAIGMPSPRPAIHIVVKEKQRVLDGCKSP